MYRRNMSAEEVYIYILLVSLVINAYALKGDIIYIYFAYLIINKQRK